MKKLLFVFAMGGVFFLTSCEKCVTCDGGGLDGSEFCSKDGDDRDAFSLSCEAAGGDAK